LIACWGLVPVLHYGPKLVDLAPSRNAPVSKTRLVCDCPAEGIHVRMIQVIRDALLLAELSTDMCEIEIVGGTERASHIEAALRKQEMK